MQFSPFVVSIKYNTRATLCDVRCPAVHITTLCSRWQNVQSLEMIYLQKIYFSPQKCTNDQCAYFSSALASQPGQSNESATNLFRPILTQHHHISSHLHGSKPERGTDLVSSSEETRTAAVLLTTDTVLCREVAGAGTRFYYLYFLLLFVTC